jgi:hypothetical protein
MSARESVAVKAVLTGPNAAPVRYYAEREYDLHVRCSIDDLGGPVPHDQQGIARSAKVRLRQGMSPLPSGSF